ncbi:MAG: peptidoglycan editing factor PgeF [Pseudomonadota bacterium]
MSDFPFPPWIGPGGPLEGQVGALSTTRAGGASAGDFAGLNLGDHVGDDADAVASNRSALERQFDLPASPLWLSQVHGADVIEASDWRPGVEADAIVVRKQGQCAAILTADCLPVLFAAEDGSVVAAAHAGWRGLAAGVLAHTVQAMAVPPADILAWIGPAISQPHYEVGDEVRLAFVEQDELCGHCFQANANGRWQADLKQLAAITLRRAGVWRVADTERCTFGEPDVFYSHRRSAPCGRTATLIWRR